MNEEGGAALRGETPPAQAAPAQPTPSPAPAAQPITPEPKVPAAQTPPSPAHKQADPIKDPSFVKQTTPAPAAATPTPAPGAATPQAAATPASAVVPDDVFVNRLSELTGGAVKDPKDLGRIIVEHQQLREQAQKGFEPKFRDERAKWAHQIISQNPGQEPEALMRTLRAVSFKPEGKTAKDVLFEAYLIDPKNSDLSQLKAQEYFETKYERDYKDIETDPLVKRQQELDVRNAQQSIEKIQSEFKATEAAPQQIDKNVENAIKSVVDGFGGVKISFSDNPKEDEFLSIAIEDPKELEAIQSEILDPNTAYDNFLSQFNTPQGFDYEGMTREVYERNHHKEIRQKAYETGRAHERLKMANELRNSSQPKDVAQVATPAAAPKKGFYDTWADAQRKSA